MSSLETSQKIGLDSNALESITSSFESGAGNLVQNVRDKLRNEFDKNADELTLGDMEIAANLTIPPGVLLTWDGTYRKN